MSCLVIGWLLLRLTLEEAVGLGTPMGVSVVLCGLGTIVRKAKRAPQN